MKNLMALPFDESWSEIKAKLLSHRNLVLVAEPGAGKTTRFPAMLIDDGIVSASGQVAVLEPRRLAARAAATRISEERGWPMKSKVGYSVRFDHQLTDSTRLAFFTEGLFLRRLASNPRLTGIECVVLDEFHERSRFTDLAIAVLKELQMLERPDLRIVVMSATIDADRIASYLAIDSGGELLKAPIVRVPGRTFPIEIRHTNEPLTLATSRDWCDKVAGKIQSISKDPSLTDEARGDLLVFLPGVGEIRRVRESLEIDSSLRQRFQVLELHGSLSLQEQSRVLESRRPTDQPRIILSTNIAETSLTIDGVKSVVDTGLARVARADRLGFSQLHIERISMASATQRAGRAGRQAPGFCFRLWSRLDENSFSSFDEAELHRVDLADSLLELYNLGITDPRQFEWFERPESLALESALQLLKSLEAIDSSFRLTPLGKEMHRTGLPARSARMLVAARRGEIKSVPEKTAVTLAAILAGILSEKDILNDRSASHRNAGSPKSGQECDLYERALALTGHSRAMVDRVSLQTLRRVIDQAIDRQGEAIETVVADWSEPAVAELLFKGFPDRVARRRKGSSGNAFGGARMVGGKGIELHASSLVRDSEFFFALKGDGGRQAGRHDSVATLASGLSKPWILNFASDRCHDRQSLTFDEDSLTVFQVRSMTYLDLPLTDGHREKADPNDALALLKEEALKRKSLLLQKPALEIFHKRLRKIETLTTDVIDSSWISTLELMLFGKTSFQFLLSDEGAEKFTEAWERCLAEESPLISKALRDLAPSHFQAPTGNRFRIDYPDNQPPFVEVRLQELFGLKSQPIVGGQPLTFHLLGPNYRPVQVTSDLPGFWKGSYFEVRKELKSRYPKHAWPENPADATPEAKGPRRRQ